MPTIKPSAAFVSSFNKYKKDGLNLKEVNSLMKQARKEIETSNKPHALAKTYEKEMTGWLKKGTVTPEGSGVVEMSSWILTGEADHKAITTAAKLLKGTAKDLIAKNPSLKDINFASAKYADFGDAGYLAISDKKGQPLKDNDPRAKLIQKILQKQVSSEFKNIAVGIFHDAY